MTDPMQIGQDGSPLADSFIEEMRRRQRPVVLELGTMRADPDLTTHHGHWLSDSAQHVRADIQWGPDVDAVADAHRLPVSWDQHFDGVIAVAVFEHLKRPWLAARQLFNCLRPGGWVFISTHHTFPEHAYPSDYWRFSREALALIFEDAGFDAVDTEYHCPCQIVPGPQIQRWNTAAPAWLVTELLAVKP